MNMLDAANAVVIMVLLFYIAIIVTSSNVKLNKIANIMEEINNEFDKSKEVPPVSINAFSKNNSFSVPYRGVSKDPNRKS
jgi:hypothetical protein